MQDLSQYFKLEKSYDGTLPCTFIRMKIILFNVIISFTSVVIKWDKQTLRDGHYPVFIILSQNNKALTKKYIVWECF